MLSFVFDMPLEQLRTCLLPQSKPDDFDVFWQERLTESKKQPLDPISEPIPYPIPEIRVEKVSFAAFDGGRIVGWFISPKAAGPHPALVFYHGYSGNRGNVSNYLLWALQGFVCFAIDVRGQNGESSDWAQYPSGRSSGWMTAGILDPKTYYFVRAYVDAVRALDYVVTRAEVDGARIGTAGCSQGGGLSLAACSLDKRPALCLSEVPGFCHFKRTLEITRAAPWTDLISYFQLHPENIEIAERTLSYVELNNLTERITCPTLISVGLLDELCVPSSIFSAYNRIPATEKQLDVFPFNGHQAALNIENQITWARRYLLEIPARK
ncbi:MAG TPA: acetylxylan esterase [Candidatus Hydrogenedentes bacterium]|nr:acetylxylan esterase [Candidatus Hydrogenedentota bacterium]HOL77260.1 acetylxylan esterase [Candidatus Hydrogenedentota bacterium]HPO86550.1 acetylxylan esterase [Candidatus Hydrogenedentota bacterium]